MQPFLSCIRDSADVPQVPSFNLSEISTVSLSPPSTLLLTNLCLFSGFNLPHTVPELNCMPARRWGLKKRKVKGFDKQKSASVAVGLCVELWEPSRLTIHRSKSTPFCHYEQSPSRKKVAKCVLTDAIRRFHSLRQSVDPLTPSPHSPPSLLNPI